MQGKDYQGKVFFWVNMIDNNLLRLSSSSFELLTIGHALVSLRLQDFGSSDTFPKNNKSPGLSLSIDTQLVYEHLAMSEQVQEVS